MPVPRNHISAEYVRSRLSYSPGTGVFTWKPKDVASSRTAKWWNSRYAGKQAGSFHEKNRYGVIHIDEYNWQASRLAVLIMTGEWPPDEVDHRNRKPMRNSWEELRVATKSQNQGNKGIQRNNTSGFKGVSWHKKTGCWRASIKDNGRSISLGYYHDPSSAAEAYKRAAERKFGDFARVDNS